MGWKHRLLQAAMLKLYKSLHIEMLSTTPANVTSTEGCVMFIHSTDANYDAAIEASPPLVTQG